MNHELHPNLGISVKLVGRYNSHIIVYILDKQDRVRYLVFYLQKDTNTSEYHSLNFSPITVISKERIKTNWGINKVEFL